MALDYVGGKDYSAYARKTDESLYDYLARLSTEREGGILGTGGLMDVKRIDPTEEADLGQVTMQCPAGYKAVNGQCVKISDSDNAEVESQYDRYLNSDEYKQGFSFEDYKMQNSLDRLTGRKYAGQGLLYGIPTALSNYADRAEIKKQLMANGYTEDQADAMVADPELASATNALQRLGTMPTREYDYKQQNTQNSLFDVGSSIVGSIFGLNEERDANYSRQSPFMTPNQYNAQGYKGLPLTANGRTAQIVEAQNKTLFDPYNQFNMDALAKQAQQMAVEESMARIEASRNLEAEAAQAARTAAYEAQRANQTQTISTATDANDAPTGSWSSSDSGTSTYSPSSWSASDTSSWDTSKPGGYDISSWY